MSDDEKKQKIQDLAMEMYERGQCDSLTAVIDALSLVQRHALRTGRVLTYSDAIKLVTEAKKQTEADKNA